MPKVLSFKQDPVPVIKAVAETLIISTSAGAMVGLKIAGPEGAKLGACVGLAAGCALIVYCVTTETDDYSSFQLAPL